MEFVERCREKGVIVPGDFYGSWVDEMKDVLREPERFVSLPPEQIEANRANYLASIREWAEKQASENAALLAGASTNARLAS